jgi:hypothetical protein
MENEINKLIEALTKAKRVKTSKLSDGYHTFCELYDHRNCLFMLLCRMFKDNETIVWRTKYDSENRYMKGWFILGLEYTIPTSAEVKQITYHLPQKFWNKCSFATIIDKSKWNGHTKEDVLKNLIEILSYD